MHTRSQWQNSGILSPELLLASPVLPASLYLLSPVPSIASLLASSAATSLIGDNGPSIRSQPLQLFAFLSAAPPPSSSIPYVPLPFVSPASPAHILSPDISSCSSGFEVLTFVVQPSASSHA
jgi:hypothetical protein